MRKFVLAAALVGLALAEGAYAATFVYSYKNRGEKTWHVCIGALEGGKLVSREAFASQVRMYYQFIGAAGDNVVLSRYGENIAERLNVKTMKRGVIASDFLRAVSVTPREIVYLAAAPEEDVPGVGGVLTRRAFAEPAPQVISPQPIIHQLPFPAAYSADRPVSTFWGIFHIAGKPVLGAIDITEEKPAGGKPATTVGKFRRIAPVPDDLLSADVSPDGGSVAVGAGGAPAAAGADNALLCRVEIIDIASGKSRVVAEGLRQRVPANSGVGPRFSVVFAGSGHVLYPETVVSGKGEIMGQRLMVLDLSSGAAAEVASISDRTRIVNAIPVRTPDGDIKWGEYTIDPQSRRVRPVSGGGDRGYVIRNGRQLNVGGRPVGYVSPGPQVWTSGGTVAFVGSLEETGPQGLYVLGPGMDHPARVNPEGSAVQTFGFLD